MSPLAAIATFLISIVFLGVVIVLVLDQLGGRRESTEFHLSRPDADEDKKEGFDFASKRQAHRKSLPGPWNRRR
jgi:hypothetical protein